MKDNRALIQAAIAGLLVAGVAATPALAADAAKEKCYGINKAGQNDCGNSKHSCAGLSKSDKDPDEWVYVAKGSCEKMGGSTKAGGKK